MTEPIDLELKDDYSPYCPECSGCGEEGCCSPLKCKFSGNCSYMETNLNHLKFGYRMFDWVERELYDKLPKELQEEFDNVWDSAYDYTYKSK